MKVAYPASHSCDKLGSSLLALKIARHSPCTLCDHCPGLHPPPRVAVVLDEHSDSSLGTLEQYGSDDDEEEVSSYLNTCACGHGVKAHNADEITLGKSEFARRGRVAIRLDEVLQDSGRLVDFTYIDDDMISLRKQLGHSKSIISLGNINSSPDQKSQSLALSPASSLLSEISHHNPAKKRRVSSSSLSDTEDIDEEDDDEDKPLAARITVGVRSVPGKRSGKQVPGKKSKKSHAALSGSLSTNNRPKTNGKVNGINGHETKVKVEEKMDENQLSRLTAGVPIERTSADSLVRTEKPSLVEMRNGLIQVTPVENDQQPRSLIILTGLKTLFQKQLPKMPREYIARLVYDNNSKSLAIIKRGYKVAGGICYRPFAHRGFAEIVFFATNSADQEKGYGGMLMDHFKAHIRKTYPEIEHFLTYADNFAVGYFEKQGFSKDISLDRSVWAGYIKDYEGGTIMQCTMLPKVDYLDKSNILKQQQEAVMTKIRQLSKSHIVHPGLPQFQPGAPPNITMDPKDVPGLRETGWSPEMQANLVRPIGKTITHSLMERLINELLSNSRAWAFREPVNVEEVVDYLEFINEPMDLGTIERKVSHNQYATFDDFVDDVQLVFDNARLYNPEESVYYKNANQVELDFKALLSAK